MTHQPEPNPSAEDGAQSLLVGVAVTAAVVALRALRNRRASRTPRVEQRPPTRRSDPSQVDGARSSTAPQPRPAPLSSTDPDGYRRFANSMFDLSRAGHETRMRTYGSNPGPRPF
jgi:hypothetical protein